jgi:hypothetical protein
LYIHNFKNSKVSKISTAQLLKPQLSALVVQREAEP